MGNHSDTRDRNIGYRYLSYAEKHKNWTIPQATRTPYVGTRHRVFVKEGYIATDELDPDGGIVYKDLEGNEVSAEDAINLKPPAETARDHEFESKSILKVVDLISEGPIEGFCSKNGETLTYYGGNHNLGNRAREEFLQSVYFDGTRIMNPELGTLNYRLAGIDLRTGDGMQAPLPEDYQFASQTIPINARLTPAPFYQHHQKDGLTPGMLDPGETNHIGGNVQGTIKQEIMWRDGGELMDDWKDWWEFQGKTVTRGGLRESFRRFEIYLEPVAHTIENHLVEEVTINIKIHVLSKLHVGKRSSERIGAECSFLIYLGNESGPFNPITPVLCEGSPSADNWEDTDGDNPINMNQNNPNLLPLFYNDTGGYFVRVARGIATSDYIFETKFHLPPNLRRENRIIKVFRLEKEQGYQAEDPNVECSLESVVESIPFKLRYPYSAVIGATIDSTATSRIPKREYDLKLLKIQVPGNYIPETKQYFGNWNGTFKNYVPIIDASQLKHIIRPLSLVTNRAKLDGTKQIKIKTGVKKYGSGSIFFPSSSGLDIDTDFVKRISIKDAYFRYPIESDDSMKKRFRICDFGFFNFTIEFFIKTSASDVKTIYKTDGTAHTTSGLGGFYKTIISSGEGSIPCGGNNESDANRNNNELYKHPINRRPFNYVSGSTNQNSLPVAGNWMIEIGTENGTEEMGRIIFRYFTYGAYYRKDGLRVPVIDSDNDLPTVEQQVALKSSVGVADDNWHHVAITREGDAFKVWIDGEDSTDTGSGAINTYKGDVRGFVYRSGTEKDMGLIEIGNDRALRTDDSGNSIHSSFNGYLDLVHIARKCKYTENFSINAVRGDGADLFGNTTASVCLLAGDDQPDDGTKIIDYNPPLSVGSEEVKFLENFGSSFLQWTDNPAWIFYDLVTNKRYGLGKYGINPDFVNKWNIYELGKYCDELVKTGWNSKYKMRNFSIVKPDDTNGLYDTQAAGEVLVKIGGFESQAEFLREFPRHSTVAIFDLNDGKRPVKRSIEYLKGAGGKVVGLNGIAHSWLCGCSGDDDPSGNLLDSTSGDSGTFEANITNWEATQITATLEWTTGGSTVTQGDTGAGGYAHSGTKSLKFVASVASHGVKGLFNLDAAILGSNATLQYQTYTLRFWVYAVDAEGINLRIRKGDGSLWIDGSGLNGSDGMSIAVTQGAWTEVAVSYIEEATGTDGACFITSGQEDVVGGDWYIDDVTFVKGGHSHHRDRHGAAVVRLLRPLALDECFLMAPQLKELIVQGHFEKTLVSGGTATQRREGLSPKSIVYNRYGDYFENIKAAQVIMDSDERPFDYSGFQKLDTDGEILDFFFDGEDGKGGLKINSTSVSGKIATEFPSSREILEPRFTCNLYLTTAIDAFKVLNDLSSVFLGLTYIVGGKVFASFDKPRDPIMNFTNSNVKDGSFVYVGSPKTARFTTALVRYIDKYESFKPKVAYVEDSAGIIKYGLIEKELIAFGCTSKGQARRLGKWFLFSAQLETDSIQFTAGKEANYLRPGDVVKVVDKNKTRKRYGGRIVNVSNSAKQITLDAAVKENVIGQTITIALPSSFETEESLDQKRHGKKSGATQQDIDNLHKPQIKEFKVSGVDSNNLVPSEKTILSLTALDDSEAKEIGKIKPGAIWILQTDDINLKVQETQFRVMNIEEENPMEYKVSCLEYNRSKFKAVEDDAETDQGNVSAIAFGGSGLLRYKEVFSKEEINSTQEQRDSYGVPPTSIEVTAVPSGKDNSGMGPILVQWDAPAKQPESYNIYVSVIQGELGPGGGEDSLGDTIKIVMYNQEATKKILYVEGDDIPEGMSIGDVKNTANITSYEFIPWLKSSGFGTDIWINVWRPSDFNPEYGLLVVHVEIRSVVEGEEIGTASTYWDYPESESSGG